MKQRLQSWGTLLCLFVLTCLLLIHTLAVFPGVPAIRWFFVTSALVLGRLDAPAWVQALGSILAIVAAGCIAGWQSFSARKDADRRQIKSDTNKALAILYILRRADLVVANAWRALATQEVALRIALDQVGLVQQALRALPVFEIPTGRLVFEVQRTDRDLLYVLQILNTVLAGAPRRKPISERLFIRIRGRIRDAMIECVESMDECALQASEARATLKNHPISADLE